MVPALALGAVAALPLLADRVDDAGLAWLSSASQLARALASNHPLRLSQGLMDGQVEWSSLINLGLLASVSLFAASEGLRLRAFRGKGLRRQWFARSVCRSLAMALFGPPINSFPAPGSHPAKSCFAFTKVDGSHVLLPDGSTVFLTLNGDQVPQDDFRFAADSSTRCRPTFHRGRLR